MKEFTLKDIEEFLSGDSFAIAGVSRNNKKFGNVIYNEMKTKGYKVLPVNPNLEYVDAEQCYPDLTTLPLKPSGVIAVISPAAVPDVIREAHQLGINNIWLQQGAASKEAIELGRSYGMKLFHGECILMYLKDAGGIHKFHKWIKKITRTLPV